ncbi:hypothetical protein [Streptomyces sp. SPB4]|uniref:hypothetical protein n=1 Tax=Streptomyces TaxID=1883 RepID=UPI002475364E|nr:hypothetical protein [Streptomyces sp. SPB4]MDH6544828.1 hypothetical protein [Streptomyces sp. SPB4]
MAAQNFHDHADGPAILYIARHEAQDAFKVGVASAAGQEQRLRAHQRQGWTTELRVEFETGHQALQAERAVLSFLRSCGATSTVPQADMPQGGYTETLADAHLMDLHLQDLLQMAQLASRLVRKAHCPLFSLLRHFGDAVGEVHRLIDQGRKDLAAPMLVEILTLLLKFVQKTEFDDMAPTVQELLHLAEAKQHALRAQPA